MKKLIHKILHTQFSIAYPMVILLVAMVVLLFILVRTAF